MQKQGLHSGVFLLDKDRQDDDSEKIKVSAVARRGTPSTTRTM